MAVWAAQAVSTRTLLGKSIKFFLAQTYSTAIRPIDIFRTSALEYTVDPDDKTEVGGDLINRPQYGTAVITGWLRWICLSSHSKSFSNSLGTPPRGDKKGLHV